jgi:hypothetical protein
MPAEHARSCASKEMCSCSAAFLCTKESDMNMCRLSEIGVRAVADLAGMPNWDWVPDAEVAPQGGR